MTKKFEEHIGNNLHEVINFFKDKEILGEITVVIKGLDEKRSDSNINELNLKKELTELIDAGLSLSAASKYLAKKKNLSKNFIYNLY